MKDKEVKLLEMFLARCQKSRGELSGNILTLSMNDGGFGKLKNRLGMIPGRNIKRVTLR